MNFVCCKCGCAVEAFQVGDTFIGPDGLGGKEIKRTCLAHRDPKKVAAAKRAPRAGRTFGVGPIDAPEAKNP